MKPLERGSVPPEEAAIAIDGIVDAWRRRDPAIMALVSDDHTEDEVREMAKAICMDELRKGEVWLNDVYQVNVRRGPEIVHLSIKRRDREACHDWRDFQAIKNQLVGPECEGVELYPAESRLVDGANQYHIFVIPTPSFRFPLGFTGARAVTDNPIGNSKQRPRT